MAMSLALVLLAASSAVFFLVASKAAKWLRAFLYLRQRLPCSERAKTLLKPTGDLANMNTPDRHRVVTALAEQHGPVFYLRALWMQAVAIADPYLINEVLSNDALDKNSSHGYWIIDKMMSDHGEVNLVSSQTDAYWRSIRKVVATSFSTQQLKKNYHKVAAAGEDLVEVLQRNGPDKAIDMHRGLLCVTVDVISRFGFNQNFGAVTSFGGGKGQHEFLDSILVATVEAQEFLKKPLRKFLGFLPHVRHSYATFEHFKTFMRNLVNQVKSAGPPAADDMTIAAQLMRCKDPATNKPLSDAQLLPMASMFFWAGYDTTGNTMTWTIFQISQHPKVEAKIVEELRQHGFLATPDKPVPETPKFEDLSRLTYLQNVIKEAQRLYPAVGQGTGRSADVDVWLDGGKLKIPAGTTVWILTHGLQNTSHIWEDHDQFIPERWEEPGIENARPREDGQKGADNGAAKRWMPFLEGRRNCVGQPLAKTSMASTLCRLYGNFSFRLADKMGGAEGVRASEALALAIINPSKGMYMHVVPRV